MQDVNYLMASLHLPCTRPICRSRASLAGRILASITPEWPDSWPACVTVARRIGI